MEMKSLDIFCEVIDNYGDIGVVYRIAKEFKHIYGENLQVRVILNRLEEFKKINGKCRDAEYQEIEGIIYCTNDYVVKNIYTFSTANVIIEAFGCNIPKEYLEVAYGASELLINLEYLSAEEWIEDFHLQQSFLGAVKLKKYFFMPGFTEKTGGIIVDSLFLERKRKVQENPKKYLEKYLKEYEVDYNNKIVGTIFSYEKNFESLLKDLINFDQETLLLLMGEKTHKSFNEILKKIPHEKFGNIYRYGKIDILFMEFLNQESYEEIINAVDFNFVRGEDSFIRAVLTGKPFLWHAYLQEDYAHMDKVEGFIKKQTEYLENRNYDQILNGQNKLLRDYNFRKENNLEVSKESYLDFFINLKEIENMYLEYSDFLILKCNLINKLNNFIINN